MPTPKQRCKDIRDRFYPEDDRPAELFYRRVMALGRSDADVVEVGCGRTAGFLQRIAAGFRRAYGVDPELTDVSEVGNVRLVPGTAEKLELPDESVDLVISIDVVEHLADPEEAFSEFIRVLRPGGRILVLTPNKLHPPLLVARLLNHRTRQTLNSWATGTQPDDTFPTFYRANTKRALERVAQVSGLNIISVEYVSNHPQYLMFSRLFYRFGVILERCLLNTRGLAYFRQLVFGSFEKPR